MDPIQSQSQPKQKASARDFFLNLGAIVALTTVVVSLLNLLFRVINSAYPQINTGYYYFGTSQSISFPVATLIIFFPIYVLLMWVLERGYAVDPEKRHLPIRRWLSYITLFVAGLTLAGDLVTVIYFFIDGQELTGGFLLKVLSVFVVTLMVFLYYIADIRGKSTPASRKMWTVAAFVIILASIIWGFAVLGSPRTQRLIKYDEQKVMDLQNINSQIQNYYQLKGVLPITLGEINQPYSFVPTDSQTGQSYEYLNMGTSTPSNTAYKLCATFNTTSRTSENSSLTRAMPQYGNEIWAHDAGYFCFNQTVNPSLYQNPKAIY